MAGTAGKTDMTGLADRLRKRMIEARTESGETKGVAPEEELKNYWDTVISDEAMVMKMFEEVTQFEGFEPVAFKKLWYGTLMSAGIPAATARELNLFIIALYSNRGTNLSKIRGRSTPKAQGLIDILQSLGVKDAIDQKNPSKNTLTVSRIASIHAFEVMKYMTVQKGGRVLADPEIPGYPRGLFTPHSPSIFPKDKSDVAIAVYMMWQSEFSAIVNRKNGRKFDPKTQMTYVNAMMGSEYYSNSKRVENILYLLKFSGMPKSHAAYSVIWFPYNEVIDWAASQVSPVGATDALKNKLIAKFDSLYQVNVLTVAEMVSSSHLAVWWSVAVNAGA